MRDWGRVKCLVLEFENASESLVEFGGKDER